MHEVDESLVVHRLPFATQCCDMQHLDHLSDGGVPRVHSTRQIHKRLLHFLHVSRHVALHLLKPCADVDTEICHGATFMAAPIGGCLGGLAHVTVSVAVVVAVADLFFVAAF